LTLALGGEVALTCPDLREGMKFLVQAVLAVKLFIAYIKALRGSIKFADRSVLPRFASVGHILLPVMN
jgi:hypothetical protein